MQNSALRMFSKENKNEDEMKEEKKPTGFEKFLKNRGRGGNRPATEPVGTEGD